MAQWNPFLYYVDDMAIQPPDYFKHSTMKMQVRLRMTQANFLPKYFGVPDIEYIRHINARINSHLLICYGEAELKMLLAMDDEEFDTFVLQNIEELCLKPEFMNPEYAGGGSAAHEAI